jgi:DNA-binding response OmpR family regulator
MARIVDAALGLSTASSGWLQGRALRWRVARILVIEDEIPLARVLKRGLTDELHAVDLEHDGDSGLFAASHTPYELVILDLMLPKKSGHDVCRALRRDKNDVPILVVTAKDTTQDVVDLLDAGADDFLKKPFAFDELLVRVRALLRRAHGARSPRVEVGPLSLEPSTHRAWLHGEELLLTAKELQLLEFLARRPGAVFNKERLLEAIWDRDHEPTPNTLEVHVATLRKKLERDGVPKLIHTVRGVGYVLRSGGT